MSLINKLCKTGILLTTLSFCGAGCKDAPTTFIPLQNLEQKTIKIENGFTLLKKEYEKLSREDREFEIEKTKLEEKISKEQLNNYSCQKNYNESRLENNKLIDRIKELNEVLNREKSDEIEKQVYKGLREDISKLMEKNTRLVRDNYSLKSDMLNLEKYNADLKLKNTDLKIRFDKKSDYSLGEFANLLGVKWDCMDDNEKKDSVLMWENLTPPTKVFIFNILDNPEGIYDSLSNKGEEKFNDFKIRSLDVEEIKRIRDYFPWLSRAIIDREFPSFSDKFLYFYFREK